MGKNRLEAFSDGVIAIIITIMVLEMKVPHGEGIETLVPLIPVFLSYVLSFVYLEPPPHAACDSKSHGVDAMGESASLVLAVPHTFRDGLDG